MTYESHRLATDQLSEIIEHRRQQGYPLQSPPHPFREAGEYHISAEIFQHKPLLPVNRIQEFETLLLYTFMTRNAAVIGWVVLPTHYHILLSVAEFDLISDAIHRLHGGTARHWNKQDNAVGNRKVWYKFSDRVIRKEAHRFRVLNYIHFNPINHGCVENVIDWPWSSIHGYYEYEGQEWLRGLWKQYPPEKIGVGWDK
jgi:putative transposase